MTIHRCAHLLALTALLALPAPAAFAGEAGYDKGFFIRGSGDGGETFALTINGRLQARFTAELPDEGDAEAAFSVPRARIGFKGHMLSKDVTYKLQIDLGKGDVALKDFFFDYRFTDGLRLRVGQYKRPFSRQQLASSSKLALVDRAITDKGFGSGRDLGLMLHNNFCKSPALEWAFGVFNGTGDKGVFTGSVDADGVSVSRTNVPDLFDPAFVARIGYNLGEVKGYDEADLVGGGLRFGVGASALVDAAMADDGDDGELRAGVDYILKAEGFASTGGFYLTNAFGDDGGLESVGFHVEANYLVAGWIMPAVRFARVMVEADGEPDSQEIVGGVALLFAEHCLKWQTDVSALGTLGEDASSTDLQIRTQLQGQF